MHHDGAEGLVDATPALEHTGEERALAQLGDLQLPVAGLGGEQSRSRSVSLRGARQSPFVALGLNDLGRLGVNQGLVEEADHLANQVAALVAPELFEHLGQVKIMVGHRSIPFVSSRTHQELLRWPVFTTDRRIYTTSGDVNLRRGSIRVRGIVKMGLLVALSLASANRRLAKSYERRQPEPPKRGRGRPRKHPGVVMAEANVTTDAARTPLRI